MDFSLSAEQRHLVEAATAFARRELNQDLAKRDDAAEFPWDAWRACASFGIQGLPVPVELGGAGSDVLTTTLVMEALGHGCHDNGILFSLSAQMWSVEMPLVTFGTPEQQQAYLPGLVSGDIIGGHAMTEPDSGSDALSMRKSGGIRSLRRRGERCHLQEPSSLALLGEHCRSSRPWTSPARAGQVAPGHCWERQTAWRPPRDPRTGALTQAQGG
jgi:hypothetical protein